MYIHSVLKPCQQHFVAAASVPNTTVRGEKHSITISWTHFLDLVYLHWPGRDKLMKTLLMQSNKISSFPLCLFWFCFYHPESRP